MAADGIGTPQDAQAAYDFAAKAEARWSMRKVVLGQALILGANGVLASSSQDTFDAGLQWLKDDIALKGAALRR